MKKYGHGFSCEPGDSVVEQESKAWSFFHSACGGKGSMEFALGIEMEIPD